MRRFHSQWILRSLRSLRMTDRGLRSLRNTLVLLMLGRPALAQHSLEIGGSFDRLDHRDDNASRLRYAGYMPGMRMAFRVAGPVSRLGAGFELRAGGLSSDRGGSQDVADATMFVSYDRRVRPSMRLGADVTFTGLLLDHEYGGGLNETFATGDFALRPTTSVAVPRFANTELRASATLVAWVVRHYSRSKAGNLDDPEFMGPGTWRDVALAIERTTAERGRWSLRYGYELRVKTFHAENGYAGVRNTLFVAAPLRVRGRR